MSCFHEKEIIRTVLLVTSSFIYLFIIYIYCLYLPVDFIVYMFNSCVYVEYIFNVPRALQTSRALPYLLFPEGGMHLVASVHHCASIPPR